MVPGPIGKGNFGLLILFQVITLLIEIHRTELQRAFFPPTYLDSTITPILKPGEKRMWANLQVFIELRDSTTLHVPFREASKVIILYLSLNQSILKRFKGLAMGWEGWHPATASPPRSCFHHCGCRWPFIYQLCNTYGGGTYWIRVDVWSASWYNIYHFKSKRHTPYNSGILSGAFQKRMNQFQGLICLDPAWTLTTSRFAVSSLLQLAGILNVHGQLPFI